MPPTFVILLFILDIFAHFVTKTSLSWLKIPNRWVPFSAKMTLKDGYWFGGFSRAPPSKQNLSTPPPPGKFIFHKVIQTLIRKCCIDHWYADYGMNSVLSIEVTIWTCSLILNTRYLQSENVACDCWYAYYGMNSVINRHNTISCSLISQYTRWTVVCDLAYIYMELFPLLV